MKRLNEKEYRLRLVNYRYYSLQVPREYTETLRPADIKAVRFAMYIDDAGNLVVVPKYE